MKSYILTVLISLLFGIGYAQNPADTINAVWSSRLSKTTGDRIEIELTALVPNGWWLTSEVEYKGLMNFDVKIVARGSNNTIEIISVSHDKSTEYSSAELNKNINEDVIVLDKKGVYNVEISKKYKGKQIEIIVEYQLVKSTQALYPKKVRLDLKL